MSAKIVCFFTHSLEEQMYMSSWETTARYMYQRTKFRVSLPYSHQPRPTRLTVCFDPTTNSIEVSGTYAKNISVLPINEMREYNPQIALNNSQSVPCVYREWLVEENAKSKLC